MKLDRLSKLMERWEHGAKILPVDQAASVPVRAAFSKLVLGKSAHAVKSYWQYQIFTGLGVPPPEKLSDKEVVAYVQRNAGAIGYVLANAPLDKVKVLSLKE